jgi:ribosomal protein L32
VNQLSGQLHLRHHISADGTYRGKQYLLKKTDLSKIAVEA